MKMDAKIQTHWWWINNNNGSNCSPWLQSTLQELNEKTMTMLKLVEDDADSFAQRAEMYYKRRPELISLVEDFYRAHRSLAERYDQLKSERSVRVKSPLKNLLCTQKVEYDNGFDSTSSVKSFDCFTEVAYSCDESAESEVDDPELDDVVEGEKETPCMNLREELDRLREENEIQRKEVEMLREELEVIKRENMSLAEVKTLECDVASVKLYDADKNEQVNLKEKDDAEATTEIAQKLKEALVREEEEKQKAVTLFEEARNVYVRAEEENAKAKRELEKATEEVMKLREECRSKDRLLTETIEEKDDEKRAVIRQLSIAMEMLREDNNFLKKTIVKDSSKKRSSQFQLSRLFSPSSKVVSRLSRF